MNCCYAVHYWFPSFYKLLLLSIIAIIIDKVSIDYYYVMSINYTT